MDSFVEDAIAIGNALTLRRLLNEVRASPLRLLLPAAARMPQGFGFVATVC